MSKKGLELYKMFIDELVSHHNSITSKRILDNSFPDTEKYKDIKKIIKKLKPKYREILANLIQEEYDSGIHYTLAYIDDKISDGLVLQENGEKYITDEFESMHYDFVCRKEGDEWPK